MSNPSKSSHAHIDYELLSHIAHEARGPYNGLIGFSDLLDSNFDTLPVERQKEYAHLVKLLATKSFFQLQTVIAWLKLVSSNFNVNHSPFHLSEAIKYAIQYNANDLKSKSIDAITKPGETGKVNGDLNYISIAFANIVSFLLVYLEKQSQIELSIIEVSKHQFSVKLSFNATNNHHELASLLTILENNPDLIPESKTTIWVAGQILKHHNCLVSTALSSPNHTDLIVQFPLLA